MNHGFNLKYNQMKDSNPADSSDPALDQSFESQGHARNICFIQSDSHCQFLNYAYLVSGEFLPQDNTIILSFTSHTVILKGIHLKALFTDLQFHIPRQIACTDSRYNTLSEKESSIVNEIQIIKSTE